MLVKGPALSCMFISTWKGGGIALIDDRRSRLRSVSWTYVTQPTNTQTGGGVRKVDSVSTTSHHHATVSLQQIRLREPQHVRHPGDFRDRLSHHPILGRKFPSGSYVLDQIRDHPVHAHPLLQWSPSPRDISARNPGLLLKDIFSHPAPHQGLSRGCLQFLFPPPILQLALRASNSDLLVALLPQLPPALRLTRSHAWSPRPQSSPLVIFQVRSSHAPPLTRYPHL